VTDDPRQNDTAEPEDLDVDPREAEDVKGGQPYVITSVQHTATDQSAGKRQHKPFGYIGETEKN
jgi:hypothetical protein